MCFPMLAGIGMLTSVLGAVGQMGAQQQQYDQQVEQYQENYANALAANRNDEQQLTLRQMQEQSASAQKVHEQGIDAAVKSAQVSVAAAGGGVAGISVDGLMADITRQEDYNIGVLHQNFAMTSAQLQTQKDASVDQAQSRIQGMAIPTAPDPTGAILGAVGGSLKAIGSGIGQGGSGLSGGTNIFGG